MIKVMMLVAFFLSPIMLFGFKTAIKPFERAWGDILFFSQRVANMISKILIHFGLGKIEFIFSKKNIHKL